MSSDTLNYAGRLNALTRRMVEERLDLVLLFDRDNVRYFTGFRLNRATNSILAISPDGTATYVVAQLDFNRAKRDCFIEQIVSFPEDRANYLLALSPLFRDSIGRIGVETDILTVGQAEYLKKLGGTGLKFVDVRGITSALRVIKSEEEIACLRRAAKIADRVMEQILGEATPGVSEAELAGKVEYLMRLEGAEGTSFEPFVTSGGNAWLPQRVTSDKPLREGELALIDLGAVYEGYSSDLTRTFAVGSVTTKQRKLFQVARRAQQAAVGAIRPGVLASEVDAIARALIEAEGLGEYFPHLTGHGVGVSTHEAPILDRGVDTVLQPGMVTTVEPGIYLPDVGAARVEDMVVVTTNGCELLTDASRDRV